MGALDAVQANQSLAHDDAAVMMESGHELGRLIQDPVRRLKLWRQEVRQGWQITWKFQVSSYWCCRISGCRSLTHVSCPGAVLEDCSAVKVMPHGTPSISDHHSAMLCRLDLLSDIWAKSSKVYVLLMTQMGT